MTDQRTPREIAAAAITEAAALIAALCPPGFTADALDINRRAGLMSSALLKHDAGATCATCGEVFSFKSGAPQRQCFTCRTRRTT